MRLYKITTGTAAQTVWAGSQTEASKARAALIAEGLKRTDIKTVTCDVPTSKDALLTWLNENVK